MNKPTIRAATPADAATVHRFICELAAYELEPDAVVCTVADLAAQLAAAAPPFECLIAQSPDDGGVPEPVGFALFFHNYSTWRGAPGLYLEDLFVPPDRRRQGIGLALLEAVAAIAVARGCHRFEWSVLDWNTPAIDFYGSLGAVPMTGWTTFRLAGEPLKRVAAGAAARAKAAD